MTQEQMEKIELTAIKLKRLNVRLEDLKRIYHRAGDDANALVKEIDLARERYDEAIAEYYTDLNVGLDA